MLLLGLLRFVCNSSIGIDKLTVGSTLFLFRLRLGPFEGPANGKPPALPEVNDLVLTAATFDDKSTPEM